MDEFGGQMILFRVVMNKRIFSLPVYFKDYSCWEGSAAQECVTLEIRGGVLDNFFSVAFGTVEYVWFFVRSLKMGSLSKDGWRARCVQFAWGLLIIFLGGSFL